MFLAWLSSLLRQRTDIPAANVFYPEGEELEERNPPAAVRDVPGFLSNNLPGNDDGSTGSVTLPFSLNFFGQIFNSVFINNNGNLTFDSPQSAYTPNFVSNINQPILAPFFADVDTRVGNILTYGSGTVCDFQAFGVNWLQVGYFGMNTDKLNTFQLILIDRSDTGAGNFDIEYNYNSIQWETGDASGGTNGLGGSSAEAGFSNGTGTPGTFFVFPGSGVNGAFLDGGPNSLAANSILAATPGRYHFQVRNGNVVDFFDVTASIRVFAPHRYIYDPSIDAVTAKIRLLNTGNLDIDCLDERAPGPIGPLTLVFTSLPPGVSVLNATGITASGNQYLSLPGSTLAPNETLTVPVQFLNPQNQPLGTFFSPNYAITVYSGNFDPTMV